MRRTGSFLSTASTYSTCESIQDKTKRFLYLVYEKEAMINLLQKFIQSVFGNIFSRKAHLKLGLYGPPNGGKCVTPDTEVVLSNGIVLPIKELFCYVNSRKDDFDLNSASEVSIQCDELGLYVPSFDMDQLKIVDRKVTHVYAQKYKGVVYQIKTSSGRVIRTTPVHPLIRVSGSGVEKVMAQHLTLNDSIAVAKNVKLASGSQLNAASEQLVSPGGTVQVLSAYQIAKPATASSAVSSELVRFVAYVLSESSYLTKERLIFSNADKRLLSDFEALSKKLFRLQPIRHLKNGVTYLELPSKIVTDYLEESLNFKLGTSEEKLIPHKFLSLPDSLIREFLRTYADCEALVSRNIRSKSVAIELSSKSKKFLEQIQLMLNRFGIVGAFWSKLVNDELHHKLTVGGSENYRIFQGEIGFSISSKSQQFPNLYNVKGKLNLPVVRLLDNVRLTQEEFHDNTHATEMFGNSKTTPRTTDMEKMKNPELVRKIREADTLWDKIVEITEIPYDDLVYDLTIQDTHTFLTSSGIIAHNTTLANRITEDWLGEKMGSVSNIPHETREVQVKEQINIKSGRKELSFNLIDTPGIATKIDYEDFVKAGMSVKKSKKRAREATKGVIDAITWLDDMDLVVVVLDATLDPYSQVNITIIGNLQARDIPVLIVANKTDLKKTSIKKIQAAFPQYDVVGISAKFGNNIDKFYEAVFALVD